MHSGDGAVFFDAGLEFHQHRGAAAVTIKNFFACETDFDGAIQQERGFCNYDFMVEGIALAAEAAAVRGGAYTNMRRWHVENFCESAMEIVRRLRAGPDGQFSIGIFDGHGSVLFDGKVGAALVEESVFEDFVGFREGFLDVAEFQSDALVNVALFTVLVNARIGSGESLFGSGNGGKNFVIDVDEV